MVKTLVTLTVLILTPTTQARQCQPRWEPLPGGGVSLPDWAGVNALAVFDDGSGPALFVGGAFETAGGLDALSLARWDGSNWSAVPGSPTSDFGDVPEIYSLVVYNDGRGPALYVGGLFDYAGAQPARNLARFDGKNWEQVGGGVGNDIWGSVHAMSVLDLGAGPELVVAGRFSQVGGIQTYAVARWNGGSWQTMMDDTCCFWINEFGGLPPAFYALTSIDRGGPSGLAALGLVGDKGGNWMNATAWVDGSWTFLDSEIQAQVGKAGSFTTAFTQSENGLATTYFGGEWMDYVPAVVRWGEGPWTALPPIGGSGIVLSVGSLDDGIGIELFAAGNFDAADGAVASGIARWDGAEWMPLGTGIETGYQQEVRATATFDDGQGPALFVGGRFSEAGGNPVMNIARWGCPACYADFTGNGVLDASDFLAFVSVFGKQDPSADCDASSVLDLFDFLCFVNAFNAGC